MKDELFLEVLEDVREDVDEIRVTLESYIILTLCLYLKQTEKIQIKFVKCRKNEDKRNSIQVCVKDLKLSYFNETNRPKEAALCHLPTYVSAHNIISGLCGVGRRITRNYMEASDTKLLGYKDNALMAPTEVSMFTKFCEIDIENCVKTILSFDCEENLQTIKLPDEIPMMECHLLQPLKVHNIYKLVNSIGKMKISSNDDYQKIQDGKKKFDFHEYHKFAEGYEYTLSDIILFSCYFIIFNKLELEKIEKMVPVTKSWYDRVIQEDGDALRQVCSDLLTPSNIFQKQIKAKNYEIAALKDFSLYRCDSKKLNAKSDKKLTNQNEIESLLEKVKEFGLNISSEENGRDCNLFEWGDVPLDAKPEGGKLPDKRVVRKRNQLECLANEVIEIAKPDDVIVDFCAGTGHLGILLAVLLPDCEIYLLENKEESTMRAMRRVEKLKLKNVTFFQCNLDYFDAEFDIGVSLHACGVASDIVLEKCWQKLAKFVCCPCCYGKINEIQHITYPRSEIFRNGAISSLDYFCFAHCADQTHDIDNKLTNVMKSKQGYFCMDVIDTDRRLRAEEIGYHVIQKRLKPENCTTKNRILIGII